MKQSHNNNIRGLSFIFREFATLVLQSAIDSSSVKLDIFEVMRTQNVKQSDNNILGLPFIFRDLATLVLQSAN